MIESSVRLHKYIAQCGITSRRKAEELISEGSVTVNGHRVWTVGTKINPLKDAIKVNGKLLNPLKQKPLYIALFKPAGVVTTLHDPEGRPTVKNLLQGCAQRVFPIGRLDYESEGLVILTNDGEYAQNITHPKKAVPKVYLVKINGKLLPKHYEKFRSGITLADGKANARDIFKVRSGPKYDWYRVVLTSGRNRQLRRMFEKLGFDVQKLRRVGIGMLRLGTLARGEYKFLTKSEAFKALDDTYTPSKPKAAKNTEARQES